MTWYVLIMIYQCMIKKKIVFLMWRKLAYVRSVGKERDRECDWDMTDLNL